MCSKQKDTQVYQIYVRKANKSFATVSKCFECNYNVIVKLNRTTLRFRNEVCLHHTTRGGSKASVMYVR